MRVQPCVEKVPWRRAWPHAPGFLPGKFHGQRSLEGPGGPLSSQSQTRLKWLSTHYFPPFPAPAGVPGEPGVTEACVHMFSYSLVHLSSMGGAEAAPDFSGPGAAASTIVC